MPACAMPATTSSPMAYQQVKDAGYKIITDGIQDIAFWDNGARYFFIQGPNNEKIEFCEILR